MKKLRITRKIILTLIKDQWHYRSRFIMDIILLFMRCGVLIILYGYVFRLKGGVIRCTDFTIVAWSIFFYFALNTLRLRDVARMVMQDVQSGAIETIFTKPLSYIFYRMTWQVGSGIISFLFAFAFGCSALVFFVGIPTTMITSTFIPSFLLTLVASAILSLIIYMVIGFIAFWIEDINPIFWLVDKTIMILGGAFFPVALFPDFLYKMAKWSPFGASQFITHTVNRSWESEWYVLIGIQGMWITITAIVLYVLNKKAQRHVFINGG